MGVELQMRLLWVTNVMATVTGIYIATAMVVVMAIVTDMPMAMTIDRASVRGSEYNINSS